MSEKVKIPVKNAAGRSWKAEHDDLMEKYKHERERNEKLEELNGKWNKEGAQLANKITQLEEELEAYRTDDNPNMTYHLQKEINELHQCLRDADEERDEAKRHAEQVMEDFKKLHKEYKEYEMEYEARYLNVKKQRDALKEAYNAALELAE